MCFCFLLIFERPFLWWRSQSFSLEAHTFKLLDASLPRQMQSFLCRQMLNMGHFGHQVRVFHYDSCKISCHKLRTATETTKACNTHQAPSVENQISSISNNQAKNATLRNPPVVGFNFMSKLRWGQSPHSALIPDDAPEPLTLTLCFSE